jgi:ribose 5-phosphate isomerase B
MAKALIANDHGAGELKLRLMAHLESRGWEVVNLGIDNDAPADYPDTAEAACREFLKGGYEFGVVCCGTGIGVSISANKFRGIRCALPQNAFAARMAREHNNANFIAFGGRIDYPEPPEAILDAYLDAAFDTGERHRRRVDKINALDKNRPE